MSRRILSVFSGRGERVPWLPIGVVLWGLYVGFMIPPGTAGLRWHLLVVTGNLGVFLIAAGVFNSFIRLERKENGEGQPDPSEKEEENEEGTSRSPSRMTHSEEGNREKTGPARIEAAKALLTDANLTALAKLDGDIPQLVNRAVQEYLSRSQQAE